MTYVATLRHSLMLAVNNAVECLKLTDYYLSRSQSRIQYLIVSSDTKFSICNHFLKSATCVRATTSSLSWYKTWSRSLKLTGFHLSRTRTAFALYNNHHQQPLNEWHALYKLYDVFLQVTRSRMISSLITASAEFGAKRNIVLHHYYLLQGHVHGHWHGQPWTSLNVDGQ